MSMRYKGGVISATADNPGNGGSGPASGVWTLTDQAQAVAATQWPVSSGFMRGVSEPISCVTPAMYSAGIDQYGNAYYSGSWGGSTSFVKLNTDNTFSTSKYGLSTTAGSAVTYVGSFNNSLYFYSSGSGGTLYQFTNTEFSNQSIKYWTYQATSNQSVADAAIDGSGNIYNSAYQSICCSFPSIFLVKTKQDGTKISKWAWYNSGNGYVSTNASGNIGVGALTRTSCVVTTQFTYFSNFDSFPSWCLYTSSWTTSCPVSFINSDGSVVLASTNTVAKFTSAGSLVWQRDYTAGSSSLASRITCDSQGNVYVVFSVTETIPNGSANLLYIVKYNSNGVIQWQRKLTRTAAPNNFTSYSITVDYNGSYYLGVSSSSSGIYKSLLLKLPTSGANASTTTFNSYEYTTATGTDSAGTATFTNPSTSAVASITNSTYGFNRSTNKTFADSTQSILTFPFS